MSVELEPVELGFKRPFNHEVSQTLRLHNPHNEPVAFKVKTTAPKQYCVRPNSGKIDPGSNVEVQVLLQAMKEDPPPDAKCRDKFLVQSVLLPADKDISNVATAWSQIEQTAKSSIQEKKIRVVFLAADDASHAPRTNGVGGDGHGSARSPSPEAFTPKHSASQIASTPVGPVSRPGERPEGARNVGQAVASAHNPATAGSSVIGSVVDTVTNAVPTSREELRQQLEEAKATIVRLTQQAQDQGLRQRKTEAVGKDAKERITSGSTSTAQPNATVGGVPVQVTAALCLLCFLLAYFFF